MSEYAPSHQARREFISSFTGSAGTAVVSADQALLWTDGRYFLQAEEELTGEWKLMKGGAKGVPTIKEWLAKELPAGARVGLDAYVHTVAEAREIEAALEVADDVVLVPGTTNLVDTVWGSDQPAPPTAPLRVHAMEHAGQSPADKIAQMREKAQASKATAMLLPDLAETAWLLNLRGADVECNPVFLSYVLLTMDTATLYVDAVKVTNEVAKHLSENGVTVKPYEDAENDVRAVAAGGGRVLLDPKRTSLAMFRASCPLTEAASSSTSAVPTVAKGTGPVEMDSPVTTAKAIKNEAEINGMQEAHARDGAVLARFFCYLEAEVAKGTPLTEVGISDYLLGLRAAQPGFMYPSFPTIAGEGPNGAVIHYRPLPGPKNRSLGKDSMLLVDSGGQYDCGTTDVTRTVHFGTPTEKQRRAFTAVLKGHIGMDRTVFPSGTPGFCLDTVARAPQWALGLNYRHGTGHGVGAALNVHEGPMSISSRYTNTVGLVENMVVSNEPGYYEDNEFGIRIENLCVIKQVETEYQFDPDTPNLSFNYLTWHPIQRKLIDVGMLSNEEKEWLDTYHARVLEVVLPRLDATEPAHAWLQANCAPL
jgi:Xaa-Pro aminopeptidase